MQIGHSCEKNNVIKSLYQQGHKQKIEIGRLDEQVSCNFILQGGLIAIIFVKIKILQGKKNVKNAFHGGGEDLTPVSPPCTRDRKSVG